MNTLITSGVKISVNSIFRKDLSEADTSSYFFNYEIEMMNNNEFPVKLISRDWYIFDSLNDPRYVSGLGVIGEQPILHPGEIFRYKSGCDLCSEFGMMKGFYTFKNLVTDEHFEVFIPTFLLEFPARLS